MRLANVAAIAAAVLLCACISTRVTCSVADLQLQASAEAIHEWALLRVNPDGSVVVSEAGGERLLSPTDSSGPPDLLSSNYDAQSATVRVGSCDTTYGWVWWPW